jgi:hypothetical protein
MKINADKYLTKHDRQLHRDVYNKVLGMDDLDQCHLNNFLWNFPILKNYPGILGFEGAFKNIPAIIVGAGPSLEKNMHLLKGLKDKALICSGDAALPVLVKKAGIYPHFVVMGDPTDKQKFNFDGMDTTKFITVVPSVVHPSIFRAVDPQHLAVYNMRSDSPLSELIPYHIGRKGGLPAGVLTSGSVFTFVAIMGCNPITFIGHDLSWPTPEKVYADGVVEKKHNFQKSVKFKSHCSLFPDINGDLVLTHTTFVNFYIWLEDCLPRIKARVFNSSEAGILKMARIKPMPLEKWAKQYCKYELTGLQEKIEEAYFHQYSDGNVEKLLLPPLKAAKPKENK